MIDFPEALTYFLLIVSFPVVGVLRRLEITKSVRLSIILLTLPGMYLASFFIPSVNDIKSFFIFSELLPAIIVTPTIFVYQTFRYINERRQQRTITKPSMFQIVGTILLFILFVEALWMVNAMLTLDDP